jgi:hypothetical protein
VGPHAVQESGKRGRASQPELLFLLAFLLSIFGPFSLQFLPGLLYSFYLALFFGCFLVFFCCHF